MGKIKININAIKAKQNISIEKTNIDTKAIIMPKIKPTLESSPEKKDNKNIIGIKKIENIEDNVNKKNVQNIIKIEKPPSHNKIRLDSIKKNSINKNNESRKEQKVYLLKDNKEQSSLIEKKIVFKNYESVFKKDKLSILEHLKKLKNLPKTNIILLSILILTTILGIGFLFYTNPKVHNLDNYKTSIIDTYKALSSKGETSIGNTKPPPKILKINKGGYIYNIQIEKVNGKNIYIYKGKYYENKGNLDKIINIELENSKKNKVIKILKNSFSK